MSKVSRMLLPPKLAAFQDPVAAPCPSHLHKQAQGPHPCYSL